jgi:hypothetical protein
VQILKVLSPSLMPLIEKNAATAALDHAVPAAAEAGVYKGSRS